MVVQVNMSPKLESESLSETEEMENGSCPAEMMKPDPDLASQETPLTQNGTTHPPQGGESRKTGLTDLLSGFKPRARCWAVLSVVLNVLQFIIILTALSAKISELSPACAACPVAACPDGWIRYLGKCYYFSQAEGNWTYSQSHCSALGASLVVIGTQQEMDFVVRYKDPSDYWIGLQREPDQPWKWANGTKFNNWFQIAGGGPCAFLNSGDVSSSSCSRDAHWICSKPVEKPEGRAK